jgi:phage terminase small subunit
MGEMTRDEALERLRQDNPAARADDLIMYVNAYMTYREASKNINTNGAVVAHPRTGAPIDNPYLKVQTAAMAALQKLRKVKNVARLWNGE